MPTQLPPVGLRDKSFAELSPLCIPVAIVGTVTWLICAGPRVFAEAPSLFLLLAILASTHYGATSGGVLAIVLATATFGLLVLPPIGMLTVQPDELPRLAAFLAAAIAVMVTGDRHRTATAALRRTNEKLVSANAALTGAYVALVSENERRDRLSEQLHLSDAYLREGSRNGRTASWRWSPELDEISWTDEHYRVFGFPPEASPMKFQTVIQTIHAGDREAVRLALDNAVRNRREFQVQFRVVLPNGEVRFLRGAGCPLHWIADTPTDFIGTTIDITEQCLTEERLRMSEHKFRTLAENCPDIVIRYDRSCNRVYANPAHAVHSGIPQSVATSQPLGDPWHGDLSVEKYQSVLRDVMETGQRRRVMLAWATPSGPALRVEVLIVPERSPDGIITNALAFGRDITAFKDVEQQLKASQRQLRQLSDHNDGVREEERKHLARELHDDLAQSLLLIRMGIHAFRPGHDTPALASTREAAVSQMLSAVDLAIHSVRSMISSTRPEALALGLHSGLEWLAEEFRAGTGVACELILSATDHESCEKTELALFRIAQECLRNVARHAQATLVRVCLETCKLGYRLELADDGVGFTPASRKAGSFGLIGVEERVVILGGTFHIASAPGQGTTISASVPHRAPHQGEDFPPFELRQSGSRQAGPDPISS